MPFQCNQLAVPTIQKEDDTVRITRWDFAPGAATGWHRHSWPYFVVLLTDAVMKIERDGKSRRSGGSRGIPTSARPASSTTC